MNTPAPATSSSANRSLLIIAGGVVLLVVLTVAAVLLAGNRAATDYPADSAEGTLQRYLAAYEDGDAAAAHAFFSSDVRERMDLDAYERAIDESRGMYAPDISRRVLFDRRTGEGDTARLQLTIEEFYGDGLDGSTMRSSREVRLVREDGAWRIDEPLVWLDPAPILEPARP